MKPCVVAMLSQLLQVRVPRLDANMALSMTTRSFLFSNKSFLKLYRNPGGTHLLLGRGGVMLSHFNSRFTPCAMSLSLWIFSNVSTGDLV